MLSRLPANHPDRRNLVARYSCLNNNDMCILLRGRILENLADAYRPFVH